MTSIKENVVNEAWSSTAASAQLKAVNAIVAEAISKHNLPPGISSANVTSALASSSTSKPAPELKALPEKSEKPTRNKGGRPPKPLPLQTTEEVKRRLDCIPMNGAIGVTHYPEQSRMGTKINGTAVRAGMSGANDEKWFVYLDGMQPHRTTRQKLLDINSYFIHIHLHGVDCKTSCKTKGTKMPGTDSKPSSSTATKSGHHPREQEDFETGPKSKKTKGTASDASSASSERTTDTAVPPIATLSDVPSDTYHQIVVRCVSSEALVPSGQYSKNQYLGVSTAMRTLVTKSSSTVFDLIRDTVCAFGLEPDDASREQYPRRSNAGRLDLFDGACFVNDLKMSADGKSGEYSKIPGLTYRAEKNGRYFQGSNPLGELKKFKITQFLDKPKASTGAESPNGLRNSLYIQVVLSPRASFLSKGSASLPKQMHETIYNFDVSLEAIGSKDSALQSGFQRIMPVRCVEGIGGAEGGNTIEYYSHKTSGEKAINDLNLRFLSGRTITGLVFPSGDHEQDFLQVARTISLRMYDVYESKTAGGDGGKKFVAERATSHFCDF